MYADAIFGICLILSISAHLVLLLPWPSLHFHSRPKVPFQKMELTYLNKTKIAAAPAVMLAPLAVPKASAPIEARLAPVSAAKPDTGKAAAENLTAKKDEQKPATETLPKKEAGPQIAAGHAEKKNDPGGVIDIGTQKGVVYEKYYLDVREKIRGVIEKNRKGLLRESEVCVKFIVERNGALKDLYLYKSNGADAGSLEELALKSIKEAAPFHPFSDKIKEVELQFNLPIRVIRNN